MMLLEWLKLKSITISKIGNDVEQPQHSFTADRTVNWFNHSSKLVDSIYQGQKSCTVTWQFHSRVYTQHKQVTVCTRRPGQAWSQQLY